MLRRLLLLAILLLGPSLRAATTQPATTRATVDQLAAEKAHEAREYFTQIVDDPPLKLPTGHISDIFTLTIEDGRLVVTPKIGATDGQMRCTVNGLNGPCTVAVFAEPNVPNGAIKGLQFAHRDFSNPLEIFRHTMLFAHEQSVQLSMDLDGVVRSKSASLIQDVKPDSPDVAIRLNAQLLDAQTDELIGQYNCSANNFRELRTKYPRQTQEFVVPILRDLQATSILAPDPRIASQVFGDAAKPDEALVKNIDAALAKFDSDNFHDREQAAKDLDALGEPAAMALRHANRTGWSIDRQSGVDDFLAGHKAISDQQSDKLRDDPVFLLDCLYSTDAGIRASAATLLEKLTQQKVDPNLAGEKRDELVDFLYARMFKPLTTQPTTRS